MLGSNRSIRGIVLAALAAGAVAGGGSAPAHAAINGFAGGDGDQVSSACATTSDWACLTPGEVLTTTDASGPTDNGFVSGSKESEPDMWRFGTGSIQAKADVRAAWTLVAADTTGRTYMHLAFARAGASGDTYLGLELNQSTATWVNGAGTTIPCRTDGDVLISYQVHSPPAITLYTWSGSRGPAACPDGRTGSWRLAQSQRALEAAMNDDGPIANFLPPSALGSAFAAKTFGEASLDLTAVADAVQYEGRACSYFRQTSVKTRGSAEITSALQDYVAGAAEFVARSCETPDPAGDTTPPAAPALTAPAPGALACSSP